MTVVRSSWYSFLEVESTPSTWTWRRLRKKSPVTRAGIDPGTFRLAAQRLNHYATPGGSLDFTEYDLTAIKLFLSYVKFQVLGEVQTHNCSGQKSCSFATCNTPPPSQKDYCFKWLIVLMKYTCEVILIDMKTNNQLRAF